MRLLMVQIGTLSGVPDILTTYGIHLIIKVEFRL